MNQTSSPEPIAPKGAENVNPPAESAASPVEAILEPAATVSRAPQEITEWGDDRYYVHHWGINE